MKRVLQVFALVLAFGASTSVFAMELAEAKQKLDAVKQQGLVGETPTGYLDVVGASGQARDVVQAINNARRDEYKRIAEKHDIPVTQVETVAGKKAIEKTPGGQYIQVNGNWVKK